MIGDHQRIDRFIEIRRRRQLEIVAAVGEYDAVIGQHVARPVWRMTFVHVADHTVIEGGARCVVELGIRQQVLGLERQEMGLLSRAQRAVGRNAGEFPDDVFHGLAPFAIGCTIPV